MTPAFEAAFQSSLVWRSLVPESFRGGCSFGALAALPCKTWGALPLT